MLFRKFTATAGTFWKSVSLETGFQDDATPVPNPSVNINDRRGQSKDAVKAFFELKNFDEFMLSYFSYKNIGQIVNSFVEGANYEASTGNKKAGMWRYMFWYDDRRPQSFIYTKGFAREAPDRFQQAVCEQMPMSSREKYVSPFSQERAMTIAKSMDRHPEIIYPTIVISDAVKEYFFSSLDEVLALGHNVDDIIDTLKELNSFFGELMPFILEAAEEDSSFSLRDAVIHGTRRAFKDQVHVSFKKTDYNSAMIQRCAFADFILSTLSRGYRRNTDGSITALGDAGVGALFEFINEELEACFESAPKPAAIML